MWRVWRGNLFLEVRFFVFCFFFFPFPFFGGVGVDGGRGPDCGLVVVRVAEGLITEDDADDADCNRKERIWSF